MPRDFFYGGGGGRRGGGGEAVRRGGEPGTNSVNRALKPVSKHGMSLAPSNMASAYRGRAFVQIIFINVVRYRVISMQKK